MTLKGLGCIQQAPQDLEAIRCGLPIESGPISTAQTTQQLIKFPIKTGEGLAYQLGLREFAEDGFTLIDNV